MRIRPYQLERLLYALTGVLAISTVLALVVGLAWPCSVQPSVHLRASGGITTLPGDGAAAIPSEADFAAVKDLDLRRPLIEGAADSQNPLPVKLVGTMIESGSSQAMLQGKDGRVEIKGVGEKMGEVEVLAIQEGSATVLYYGQKIVLKVEHQ